MKIGNKTYKMRFSLMTLDILQDEFDLSFDDLSKIDKLGVIFQIAYAGIKCELLMKDQECEVRLIDVKKAIDKDPSIIKKVMEGASQMGEGLQSISEPAKN